MLCVFCSKTIDPSSAWKGTFGRFYCSEFCADSETVVPVHDKVQKEQIDRQYLQRLERLVPLRQANRPR